MTGCVHRSIVLAALVFSADAEPPTSAPAEDGAWTSLIQSNSLDGWVRRGGKAPFRIEDDVIIGQTVSDTSNSFLCTQRDFDDIELELEFMVDPGLNSGVQIRSNCVPGYRGGVVHGYQVEIDPSERAWTGGIYDESRRGWLAPLDENPVAQRAFRPAAWNRLRIVARGNRIQTWINDVPAADLTDGLTRTGFIGLQVHRTRATTPKEVRWRRIRVREFGKFCQQPPLNAIVLLAPSGDLSAWQHPDRPRDKIGWTFRDGVLEVTPGTGNIETRRDFGDCRLHVEFCVTDNGRTGQANGNSGVFLQGRYEVQILNSVGQEPADDTCGALYGAKAPDYNMSGPADQWQTYDVVFRAPRWSENGRKNKLAVATVYHNGTRIHDRVRIGGRTGSGRPEGSDDGPLVLQEHGNRVRFRNIWIAPLDGCKPKP